MNSYPLLAIGRNQLGGDIPCPYSYDSNSMVYAQMLPSVVVHISEDGSRIAFGSNYLNLDVPGQVQVFEFDTVNKNWSQLGATINASKSNNGDGFGYSMAMTPDGNLLVVGSLDPLCDGVPEFCKTGAIEFYAYDSYNGTFRPAWYTYI